MRKAILSVFILLFGAGLLRAQDYVLPLWDVGNDNFAQKKNFSLNSTFTSRYNFNDKVQLAAQLPLWPLMPNLQTKIRIFDNYKNKHAKGILKKLHFGITTVHTAVFPSFGFNTLAKIGIAEPVLPSLGPNITLNNEILLSFYTNANKVCNYTGNKLTIKLGLRNTFGSDTSLTLPQNTFWHLSTATFKHGYLYYLGLNYDSKILNNLNFSTAFKWIKIHDDTQILENYSFFYFGFGFNKRSTIAIGYIADISAKNKQYSIMPAFNLKIKWKKRMGSDIDKYLRY